MPARFTQGKHLRLFIAVMVPAPVLSTLGDAREAFEQAVRGFYRLEDDEEEGRIGPLIGKEETPGTAASARVLFKGPLTAVPLDAPDGTARSPSPLPASSRY